MFKRLIPLFTSLCLLLSVAYAGENYTLSGDVTFQYDGDIYMSLYKGRLSRFDCLGIPTHSVHPFRIKSSTDSDLIRPRIPNHSVHLGAF